MSKKKVISEIGSLKELQNAWSGTVIDKLEGEMISPKDKEFF